MIKNICACVFEKIVGERIQIWTKLPFSNLKLLFEPIPMFAQTISSLQKDKNS